MKKNNGGRGTIHVTWAECPNKECLSRQWEKWDVEFEEDRFRCGTCEIKLLRPIFMCPLASNES